MKIFENSLSIIKSYEGFIVDVWGVIHSGGVLYSNTSNAMLEMMSHGKVLLLSNAPRRAKKVQDFLSGIGIKQGQHYHHILTSGEAFVMDAQRKSYRNIFYIGPEKDLDVLDNTGIDVTRNINDNFDDAIITGLTDDHSLEPDLPTLQALLQKNVAVSCINPDIVVKSGGGNLLCAGALAKEYEKIGGKVKYFGKPYGEVYEMAFDILGSVTKNKILAIGDGMETDILGASKAGIDSMLCVTGIHEKEIYWSGIDSFLANHQQQPRFVVHAI